MVQDTTKHKMKNRKSKLCKRWNNLRKVEI